MNYGRIAIFFMIKLEYNTYILYKLYLIHF